MTDLVYKRDDYLSWKMRIENNNGYNKDVYNDFKKIVENKRNLKILDIGTGCGGLIHRMIGLNTFKNNQTFIGVDIVPKLLESAVLYMADFANETGYVLKEAEKADAEISSMTLEKGKIKHTVKFYESSAYDSENITKILGGKADIVMGNTVFEHLNAEIAMKSFKKYLKEGGILFLPVNADHDLIIRPEYADNAFEEKIIDDFLDFHFDGLPNVEFEGKQYKPGDRSCGRNLHTNLSRGGFDILSYGGSQKTIRPTKKTPPYYNVHEIKYMEFFLNTMENIAESKMGYSAEITKWRSDRRKDIENGKAYMFLKQMDILARNNSV